VHVTYVWCSNRITSDGAGQIAELLKCNTALEVLDLSYNRIGDDGATAIAAALAQHNTHLKTWVHYLSITSHPLSPFKTAIFQVGLG